MGHHVRRLVAVCKTQEMIRSEEQMWEKQVLGTGTVTTVSVATGGGTVPASHQHIHGQVRGSTWQPVNKGDSGGCRRGGELANWRRGKGSIYCQVTPLAGG